MVTAHLATGRWLVTQNTDRTKLILELRLIQRDIGEGFVGFVLFECCTCTSLIRYVDLSDRSEHYQNEILVQRSCRKRESNCTYEINKI